MGNHSEHRRAQRGQRGGRKKRLLLWEAPSRMWEAHWPSVGMWSGAAVLAKTPQWFSRLWVQHPSPFFGTQTTFMWLASQRVWHNWWMLSPLSSPFAIPPNQLRVKNLERSSSHNHSTTEPVSSLLQPLSSITSWVTIIKNTSVKIPSYHGDKKTVLQRRDKNCPSSLTG